MNMCELANSMREAAFLCLCVNCTSEGEMAIACSSGTANCF